MFEETVLDFDRGYLGTGDFESILNLNVKSKSIFSKYYSTVAIKLTFARSAYLKEKKNRFMYERIIHV